MNTSKTHTIDSPLRLCHGNNLSEQQNKLKITMKSNNNVVVVGCENMITKNSPITGKNKNKKMDNGSLNKMNMKMKMKMNMMRSSRLSESESTLLINYSTTSMNSMNSACNMPSLSSNAFNIDDDDDDDDNNNNNNSNSTKCQQQTQKQHKRLLQMLQGRRKKEESTNVLVEKDDFTLLLQQLECTGDDDEEDEQQQEEDDEENTSLLLIPVDPSSSDMINATIIKDCIDDTCSTADADTDNDTASFISTINDTDTKSNTIANSNAVICTTTSSSSTKTRRKKQKHVHFGSLIIHEHPLVMGGAGLPSNGPSITLSWRQDTCLELPSVLLYEESRPCLPRKGIELLHPKNQRIDLLLGSGYTFREIKECEKECDIIRKQRIQTVKHIQQRSSFTKIGNKIRKNIFKQPRRTATTKGKVR